MTVDIERRAGGRWRKFGILTARDGKVARYLEYSDTAAIQAACAE